MTEPVDVQLARIPCPRCGNLTLVLEERLVARPRGTWSLAGWQDKVSAVAWPHAVCRTSNCGFTRRATVVDRPDDTDDDSSDRGGW